MKYYLVSYMAKPNEYSWSHGNLWVKVKKGSFLSIKNLKNWLKNNYKIDNDKATIISFQEISKKQYMELSSND